MSTETPFLEIEVQIGSPLWERLALPQQVEKLVARVARRIQITCEELGIADRVKVSIARCPADRLLRVRVDNNYHAASDELTHAMWNSIMPGGSAAPLDQRFSKWFAALPADKPSSDMSAKVEIFVTELSEAIIRRHPEKLLGVASAADLLDRAVFLLDAPRAEIVAGLSHECLIRILCPVLEVGASLSDQVCVLREIANGLSSHKSEQGITEALIADLSQAEIRVRIGPECWLVPLPATEGKLSEFSLRDPAIEERTGKLFQDMCKGLLSDLGIRVPEILFEIDPQQDELTFRVAINHHLSAPQPLLRPDECIALAQPDELPSSVKETCAVVNPENGATCCVVPKNQKKALDEAGFRILDPLMYLVQCIGGEIRREGWRLMNSAAVATELALLASEHSTLALAAQQKLTSERLAPVLRRLLKEQTPVRDFVCLLEHLLAFERITADSLNLVVFDDRFVVHPRLACRQPGDALELAEYARSSLKHSIARRNAPRGILRAYQLDPRLELSLLDHLAACLGDSSAIRLDSEALDRIRLAIIQAQAIRGRGDSRVAIVCSSSIRFFVRELIADDLPEFLVLSYEETGFGHEIIVQSLMAINFPAGLAAAS